MRINQRPITTRLAIRIGAICLATYCITNPLCDGACAQRTLAIRGATVETASDKGTLQGATILIKNGKISAVGTEVEIPVSARIVEAAGKTILPGIVDPYFVVTISRNTTAAATRTVIFNGRVFTIGGGPPAIATTFATVADGLDLKSVNWQPAIRSGITTLHVVTGGYARSIIASATVDPKKSNADVTTVETGGKMLVTVSNDTKSLDVLRKNLAPPKARTNSSRPNPDASSSQSPTSPMWAAIRDGKSPVFVNVNNASAILHAEAILAEYPKAQIALIADGANVFLALESIAAKRYTVILPPAIDRVPNSADRINVARLLANKGVKFAISLSLGQSDFRAHQSTPLFGAAMLVRSGLDRQAAIRSLTIEPAKLIGMDKTVGSLEPGKDANLIVFGEDPFSATSSIEQVYVSGEQIHE